MSSLHNLPMGFRNPVADSQASFRAALRAMSRPGEAVACEACVPEVPGLMPATVALLLALTDHETPVWWTNPAPSRWLQFHTGAATATTAANARFAVASGLADARQLGARQAPVETTLAPTLWGLLDAGTDESPERSATLFMELPSLAGGTATEWSGPGLRHPSPVHLAGLPEGFWGLWQDNHARFPRGVDVLFVCGRQILGLPRTTLVRIGQNTMEAR